MLLMFILLSIMAILLIGANPKSPVHWWVSIFLLLAGFGGLAVFLDERYIRNPFPDQFNYQFIYALATVLSLLCHYFLPYALLMFSINYSGRFTRFWRSFLALTLIAPGVILLILFPADIFLTSKSYAAPFRGLLTLYTTLYTLAANSILIDSYRNQAPGKIKHQKLMVCIIAIPTTLMWLLSTHILVYFKINGLWKYNPLIAAVAFITFILVALRHGFMGLKIKIERECLENTMKASSSGASILNHTIKNEMANIMLCMHNIQHHIGDLNNNIQIVLNSLSHFREMTDRINLYTREIVLNMDFHNLAGIMNESLDSLSSALTEKQIQVFWDIPQDLELYCDQVHLRETLKNLFKNAVEAMSIMGRLEIGLRRERRLVIITIKDDGEGISEKNLPFVLTPFFTTRKFGNNYGLGLSYCYQIIQKHGGKMEIESEPGAGATVSVYFPASRTKIS